MGFIVMHRAGDSTGLRCPETKLRRYTAGHNTGMPTARLHSCNGGDPAEHPPAMPERTPLAQEMSPRNVAPHHPLTDVPPGFKGVEGMNDGAIPRTTAYKHTFSISHALLQPSQVRSHKACAAAHVALAHVACAAAQGNLHIAPLCAVAQACHGLSVCPSGVT